MDEPRRCSICGRDIPSVPPGKIPPRFCSPRCRSIDLAGWLEGRYRISSSLEDEEVDAPALQGEKEDN